MTSINRPINTGNVIIVTGIGSVAGITETRMRPSDLRCQNRVGLQVANVDIDSGVRIAISNMRITHVVMMVK